MSTHAHRAPFRSTAWSTVDEALIEFLTTPCSPPSDLFFDEGTAWNNEAILVRQLGARALHAPDRATFDAVRLKYEATDVETFEQAFRVLGAACERDWARFDLDCLRDCCEAFRSFELPDWVADACDRDPDAMLVSKSPALFMSVDMTWCTPEVVLEHVRLLGPIGLDPCSNGRSIVRASVEWRGPPGVDGLAERWVGRGLVYVNPPYGRAIAVWMTKCTEEAKAGAEIVALVPARTDTKWRYATLAQATAVCFWRGRLAFLGASAGAPFPSALFYFGTRAEEFATAFADCGWVVL